MLAALAELSESEGFEPRWDKCILRRNEIYWRFYCAWKNSFFRELPCPMRGLSTSGKMTSLCLLVLGGGQYESHPMPIDDRGLVHLRGLKHLECLAGK